MDQLNCSYCGSQHPGNMLGHEADPICPNCHQSKGEQMACNWFFWLKANDPQHWQKIVDHHRMGMDPLASTIRRIRVDP